MRIISQDGRIDLPYEKVGVQTNNLDKKAIIAYPIHVAGESHWTLAHYSTKEKAEEVMKMLRTGYSDYQQAKSRDGYSFAFNYPKVFRFPPDSEV